MPVAAGGRKGLSWLVACERVHGVYLASFDVCHCACSTVGPPSAPVCKHACTCLHKQVEAMGLRLQRCVLGTSIAIDSFGTGKIEDEAIAELVREHFDLRPKGLVAMLNLKRPIYRKTAAYGHFGREDRDFTWEKKDKAKILKKAAR